MWISVIQPMRLGSEPFNKWKRATTLRMLLSPDLADLDWSINDNRQPDTSLLISVLV